MTDLPQAPVAKRVPTERKAHGEVAVDEYAWLRDRDDPDTIAYLEAENAHSDGWFAERTDLVEAVFQEIKRRTQETDTAAPVRVQNRHGDDWWYVTSMVDDFSTLEGTEFLMLQEGQVRFEGSPHELQTSDDPYIKEFLS